MNLATFLTAGLVPRPIQLADWVDTSGWRVHYRKSNGQASSWGPYNLEGAMYWMRRFTNYDNIEAVWIAKVGHATLAERIYGGAP